jgi:hypothetical protein
LDYNGKMMREGIKKILNELGIKAFVGGISSLFPII